MAQTYEQLIERLNDPVFQKRCEYSVLFLVRWVKEELDTVPFHEQRMKWANAAMPNATAMAWTVSRFVITDGSCIGDTMPTQEQIKGAIETLINTDKWMLA